MFARVRFSDKSEGVYALKQVTRLDGNNCIVKHRGSKYEATIIAMNSDKEKLNHTNFSISLEDFSFGTDLIEVNTSNSFLEKSFPSDISLIECERSQNMQEVQDEENSQDTVCERQEDSVLFDLQNLEPTKPLLSPEYYLKSNNSITELSFNEAEEPSEFEDNSDDDPNYEITDDISENGVEIENSSKSLTDISNRNINSTAEASFMAPSTSVCDDVNLVVMESNGRRGDKKANCCLYCHKKQHKITRHLENMHKDQEEVRKFMLLPKGNSERKHLIGLIRKKGNFLYNTNENVNEGDLIVARRRQKNSNKTAKDFKACANCKGFFSKNSLRAHFAKCTGKSSKTKRTVMLLSKKVTGRIHFRASEAVKNFLFPSLQEDDIIRLVRYDELVIIFANKMCEKYKNPRFYDMIRHRIRLLGRFLLATKKLNKEVTDLASVFDPKFSDDTLGAINEIAKFNRDLNSYETPTVAFSLGTLLKQVGNLLITESIKKHDQLKKSNCKDYLKILSQEINFNVNRTVAESQLQIKRRKTIDLPPMEDIKKLHKFLLVKRTEALKKIKKQFSSNNWTELAKSTLLSIQVFNRRRPGETERILIEDFMTNKGINDNNQDLFQSLSSETKKLADKYVRFCIRGKLNRTVPVLLDKHLLECVKNLIKFRSHVGVTKDNPYVFGIPGKTKRDFAYLRACPLMRQYSQECGARFPKRLRATSLRKHIATTCITLNLQEQEVSDVANFMGHGESIHKKIYRQPIESREILFMSKILEKVQGDEDKEENCEGGDDGDEEGSRQDEGSEDEESDVDEEVTPHKKPTSTVRKRSTSPYGSVKRIRWSYEEKEIVMSVFKENIINKSLPSLKVIQNVIRKYPQLQKRSSPQIKAWIHNQFKSKKKLFAGN